MNTRFISKRPRDLLYISLLCAALMYIAIIPEAHACAIPVSRYALLYWPADFYEAVVFHKGPLSKEDQALVDRLMNKENTKDKTPANIWLETVDVSKELEKEAKVLWDKAGTPTELPYIVLYYPRYEYPKYAQFPKVVWSGPLTGKAVNKILYSPVRREVAKRLFKGDMVIWILLESGIKEKDDEAFNTIKKYLDILEKEWQLPEEASEPLPGMPAPDAGIPLEMKFSVMRMSRTDEKEEIFLNMLLDTEKDLKTKKGEPMAFPIFGRGRMLEGIVGKGINEEMVVGMCGFLVGPCSCQIKGLNPGVDLLFAVDWEGALSKEVSIENALPATILPGPVVKSEKTPLSENADASSSDAKDASLRRGYLPIAMAVVIGLIVIGVFAGTLAVLKKKKEE